MQRTVEGGEDGEESSLSLSAMEQALLPSVLETFDALAKSYGRLRKVQENRLAAALSGNKLTAATDKRHAKLASEITELVKSVRLNNARLEALVDELYGINRRLVGFEGQILRLAERNKVPRDQFAMLIRSNPTMIHSLLVDMAKHIMRLNKQVVDLSVR